jgi:hypothetical protein
MNTVANKVFKIEMNACGKYLIMPLHSCLFKCAVSLESIGNAFSCGPVVAAPGGGDGGGGDDDDDDDAYGALVE